MAERTCHQSVRSVIMVLVMSVPLATTPPQQLSASLRNTNLRSPMPGGSVGGWYGDTGVDISGRFLPVYAVADGVLEYSEWGHTLWRGQGDTPFSVRLRLDHPITSGSHRVTHVYYTHLSSVVTVQPEASTTKKHVVAGERIATSGIGNHVPHLHLGFLLDNQVEQDSWEFILREDAIRALMGGYRNGEVLP
jgi:murein DD-endopeptidase MepM/ murein hydrolase activator NlpD